MEVLGDLFFGQNLALFSCWTLFWPFNLFQRYTLFKKKNLLQPLDEIAETRYIYSYVNLLSKATFWWILGLLREGYKHVLDLQHLGRLPTVREQAWSTC